MPPKPESSSFPPSIEASMVAMVDKRSHLVTSTNTNQATTQSHLDIIMKQLTTQYDQTNVLLATLIKQDEKSKPSNSVLETEFKQSSADNQPRHPKNTLPPFNGTNPHDWLFQGDQYFSFYCIQPPVRLNMAPSSSPGTH